jgi:hypothetical protein
MKWLVDGAHADDALFIHCEWTEMPKHGWPSIWLLLQIRDTAVGRATWMAMSWMVGMKVEQLYFTPHPFN